MSDVTPDLTPIFITGRFRSGTTFLWSVFDQLDDHCAYYEPCHDNLLSHIRHTLPMESHRNVADYFSAYRPLLGELEHHHQHAFGLTRLLLGSSDSYRALESYLRFLIKSAHEQNKRPVLQFNRMDFRLPWLREKFPNAKIVHVARDVRESYASMVAHLGVSDYTGATPGNVYDVLEWCVSLADTFPFLIGDNETTFYHRHYLLWRLSHLMGVRCADISLSFDDQVRLSPEPAAERLIAAGLLPQDGSAVMNSLHEAPPHKRSSLLHEAAWYETVESHCEAVLEELGLIDMFARAPLAEIRSSRDEAWRAAGSASKQRIIDQLLVAYSRQRSEVTRLLAVARATTSDAPSGAASV